MEQPNNTQDSDFNLVLNNFIPDEQQTQTQSAQGSRTVYRQPPAQQPVPSYPVPAPKQESFAYQQSLGGQQQAQPPQQFAQPIAPKSEVVIVPKNKTISSRDVILWSHEFRLYLAFPVKQAFFLIGFNKGYIFHSCYRTALDVDNERVMIVQPKHQLGSNAMVQINVSDQLTLTYEIGTVEYVLASRRECDGADIQLLVADPRIVPGTLGKQTTASVEQPPRIRGKSPGVRRGGANSRGGKGQGRGRSKSRDRQNKGGYGGRKQQYSQPQQFQDPGYYQQQGYYPQPPPLYEEDRGRSQNRY